eukprot:tig00000113_g5628.t1
MTSARPQVDRGVGLSIKRVLLPFRGPAAGLVGSGTVKTARLLARTPGVTVYLLQLVHSSEDPRPQMEEEQLVKKKCSARFQFLRRVALDLTDLAIEESVKGYDLAIVPAPRDSPPPSTRLPLARLRSASAADGPKGDREELDVERFVRGTQLSVLVVHARAADAETGESVGAGGATERGMTNSISMEPLVDAGRRSAAAAAAAAAAGSARPRLSVAGAEVESDPEHGYGADSFSNAPSSDGASASGSRAHLRAPTPGGGMPRSVSVESVGLEVRSALF